jgi:hypothetical protein
LYAYCTKEEDDRKKRPCDDNEIKLQIATNIQMTRENCPTKEAIALQEGPARGTNTCQKKDCRALKHTEGLPTQSKSAMKSPVATI